MALRKRDSIPTLQETDKAVCVQKYLAGGGEESGSEEFRGPRLCPSPQPGWISSPRTESPRTSTCQRDAAFKSVDVSMFPGEYKILTGPCGNISNHKMEATQVSIS